MKAGMAALTWVKNGLGRDVESVAATVLLVRGEVVADRLTFRAWLTPVKRYL